VFLKSIRIENVRAIADLELDFDGEDGGARKWTLLLGENGTGKSTILRCIALLLCGRDALPELLGRDPSSWIRSGRTSARIDGTIATAQGDEREVHLELHRDETISKTLDRNAEPLAPLENALAHTGRSYFLAGYGASRRLGRPRIPGDERRSGRAGRVRTLFDADAALWPLASWAMDLHYVRGESFLSLIRSAVAQLLPGVTFRNIDKVRKTLIFDTPDGPVSLDDLSDGYQNVAAWVGDLLYRTTLAFDDYSNPLATRGLLLIDEIDLHLHVKWQRRLRRFIDNKLPNLQIVATTHSPMTAQQAGRGEVHVLARPTPEAAPEIRGYDIAPDRLGLHQLIEPLFDVDTVDSARIASLKDQYRALKAKGRRSADEDRRVETLREKLVDAPEWNGGEGARAQIEALRSIQALIEKAGVAASEAPADKAPRVKPLRSKVGRKVVVE
jgi:energy-coupling factor transporter ATP-binding protein EcfA2